MSRGHHRILIPGASTMHADNVSVPVNNAKRHNKVIEHAGDICGYVEPARVKAGLASVP